MRNKFKFSHIKLTRTVFVAPLVRLLPFRRFKMISNSVEIMKTNNQKRSREIRIHSRSNASNENDMSVSRSTSLYIVLRLLMYDCIFVTNQLWTFRSNKFRFCIALIPLSHLINTLCLYRMYFAGYADGMRVFGYVSVWVVAYAHIHAVIQ